MRIAIITLPFYDNYGAILQNYALQTVLKRMGHNVETLDLLQGRKRPLWQMPLVYGKRFIMKYVLHRPCHIFYEEWSKKNNPTLLQYMHTFIDQHIHVRKIERFKDVKEGEYDVFIVGSDQIWRPSYTYRPVAVVYLSFTRNWKNIRRVAYAASFGTESWEYSPRQTKYCATLAKLFDAVSVREVSAIDLCKKYLGIKSQYVLDPTMLLCAEDYLRLLKGTETNRPDCKLLTYILDFSLEKEEIIKKVSREYNYKPFRANSRYDDLFAPLNERIQPSVEQWLKDFTEALFIITDSFHATVFSILFGKPFIVIGNKERGLARIHSLLSIFGIENHLVFSLSDLRIDQDYSLNLQQVQETLQFLRKESLSFLQKGLGI